MSSIKMFITWRALKQKLMHLGVSMIMLATRVTRRDPPRRALLVDVSFRASDLPNWPNRQCLWNKVAQHDLLQSLFVLQKRSGNSVPIVRRRDRGRQWGRRWGTC